MAGMDWLVSAASGERQKQDPSPSTSMTQWHGWASPTCHMDSIAMGSQPVPVPDFTNGKWIKRGTHRPPENTAWMISARSASANINGLRKISTW